MSSLRSAKPVVAVCRPIPEAGLKLLKQKCTIRQNPDRVLTPRQLRRFVAGASALVTLLTDRIDARVLAAAGPQLKLVANYAVGFDNIDLLAAARAGVVVTNTPGQLTESVAEHSFALMMTLARRIAEADRFVRAGKYKQWEPLLFWGQPLVGQTLGLVGAGRIGHVFGQMAHHGLRMRILYYDLQPCAELEKGVGASRVSLRELLRRSDVVSLHVPLCPATHHLIGERELSLMKPTATLINTARGPVVDEAALISALQEEHIFAAGLDVYEHEPRLSPALKRLPNVVLTPHIGSATAAARNQMSEMVARNILAVLSGKPPVNPVPNGSSS